MKLRPTIILTCAALSLGAFADAQINRAVPGQTMRILPNDATTLDQRVAALEAQVAALTTRLERAENSTRESNFKVGAATNWIESHGPGLLTHTHSYKDKTTWVNHTCENANAGPDHVPCSQITGASEGTTSAPQ